MSTLPSSQLVDEKPDRTLTEKEIVACWRFEMLLDAGYDVAKASALAVAQVDLHRACQLVGNGCPPELAAEILL